jgi:hypothetical protein
VARAEARILVSIWTDPDFRALSPNAQWAYMFLLSQQDLAHTGVIPLRVRRWAQSAEGMTPQVLGEALRRLEAARFIVADRDCEELLIRSFIRRDKVYKQPQVFRAAADALPLVTSRILRSALAEELARVADEEMVPSSRAILEEMRAALPQPGLDPAPHPAGHPEPEPAPGTPGVRGVVTVSSNGFPVPRSPEPLAPDPGPLPLASLAGTDSSDETTAQTLIGEWLDQCKVRPHSRTIGAVGKHVKAMLDEDIPAGAVRVGLEAWRAKGADPSTLYGFVNQAANAEPRGSPGAKPSTTDARVGGALAIADDLDRKELTA